ncbi:hybrid sensor histidine kinase/response regulator transcription factor [Siphonobacter sp. SORGH_AS_0500]|uniref:hybrid sensor histidine kinase/response regulator transcription factor n=1 Tax=Siphonobacter sp. SORGH_AS_0500 TaxID=1864824 RepID=UPI001E3886F7|nr:hybrid sensor histidine kinase/response regulator transcription factor [Siphonobacter sp. SORGH_AS_0500]
MIRFFLLVTLAILNNAGVLAQKLPLEFKSYSNKDGLSSSTIYGLCKDHFGFLWLATEDGLNRFDGTNFKVYRHDAEKYKGLKVNHITVLFESNNGDLWIGTNGGSLSYYDRLSDSIIPFEEVGDKKKIQPAITHITADDKGNIWITSYGALYIIDPITKKLLVQKPYQAIMKHFEGQTSLYTFQDRKHQMWIGTDQGLWLYDKNYTLIRHYTHEDDNPNSLTHNYISAIVQDSRNQIWVSTIGGLSKLEAEGSGFKNFNDSPGKNSISSNTIYALAADDNGKLWLGTDEGLDVLDLATENIVSYGPDSRDPHSLSSRSIRSILVDEKGIYWIGTYQGGLNQYDKSQSHFKLKQSNAFDPFGLKSSTVTSFAEYRNRVFVGTDGGGLHEYIPQKDLFRQIQLPDDSKNISHDLSVLALAMDRNQQLWVGTYLNGLFCYQPDTQHYTQFKKGNGPKDLNSNAIFCLKEDRQGNLWIGTNGGGINILNVKTNTIEKLVSQSDNTDDITKPSNNYIRAFEEDKSGRIWAGTFGGGISLYNPKTKTFSFYKKKNSGLPSNYILSIKEDSKGTIWVGTNGNGLAYLTPQSKKFKVLSESDGLINGVVLKIIETPTGELWLSTNKGLSCFNPLNKRFKNYTHHHGLQGGAFVLGSGLQLSTGELYFGGQSGFNHFKRSDIKINNQIPEVVLTELKIDNQAVVPSPKGPIDQSLLTASEIRLAYKQNFSIHFEALNFTVPEHNHYRYKLEGVDNQWVDAGKEHSAYYTNLSPGEYTFQVIASNNDGLWNTEGRSIRINVAPPFWQSIYAYVFYVLVGFGILFLIRRRSINQLKQKFAIQQERLQASQRLEQQRKEAEYLREFDRMKIKFLTNLSHEFRTPISLIAGPAEKLLKLNMDESASNQLNLINRNARRLSNLVNQLLDFRKLEEQELKLHLKPGQMVAFLKDVVNSFNDLAIRKNIILSFSSEMEEATLYFDENKVERILFNLLSNAFKFTPEKGSIRVSLEECLEESTAEVACIAVSVKDSGIGIPAEAQSRIFESFFQHDTGPAILNQGTGIGLSIVKEFVKMHDGHITVESAVGLGSKFTFRLRLKREVSQELAVVNETLVPVNQDLVPFPVVESSGKNSDQPLVLIVEDDEDFRFYIKENLRTFYRLFEATNGKEAWQRILFHHPDIIVCDINMPEMNGLELTRKLKADKRTKHIPIILLTAAIEENGPLSGLESGATDYITKPFDFAVLQAKMNSLIALNRVFKDTYTKQVVMTSPNPEIVPERERFLEKVLAYIHDNLSNPQLSVETLSSHLSMSRASLYNRLLEFTGMTPVEYIRSIKLERAALLLNKSDMNIAEVAYEIGFANPNYFTKVFKAHFNMTPSEYIQKERTRAEGIYKITNAACCK